MLNTKDVLLLGIREPMLKKPKFLETGKFIKASKTEGRIDRLRLPVPASCSVCLLAGWRTARAVHFTRDLVLIYIRGANRTECLRTRNLRNRRRTRRIRSPKRDMSIPDRIVDPQVPASPSYHLWRGNIVRARRKGEKNRRIRGFRIRDFCSSLWNKQWRSFIFFQATGFNSQGIMNNKQIW